jgi:Mg-chelatase subunit ChlD
MTSQYSAYFAQPWWLLACGVAVPLAILGLRNLGGLSRPRRFAAIALRCCVVAVLALALARPTIGRKSDTLTVIAVIDRSRSVQADLQRAAVSFLSRAKEHKEPADQLAVVDVAESAVIAALPGPDSVPSERSTSLVGQQSRLSSGIEMATAIAPSDSASRILLISDGNETEGDLLAAVATASANGIPVDVLPLRYSHDKEVVFRKLVAPARASSGQSINLRFVLESTGEIDGALVLDLNGEAVDLDPSSPALGVPVRLKAGTNVKSVTIPVGTRGVHQFDAHFVPAGEGQDAVEQNNRAGAVTLVVGPGHVLVVDVGDDAGKAIAEALAESKIDARRVAVSHFPDSLPDLLSADAVVLANTDNSNFTLQQQEMLCRYVTDLGGGLILTGGPDAFGAGGWIGSPVAEIAPVDMDPPQKQVMPRGALVLVVDRSGSMGGRKLTLAKNAAAAAARTLSSRDYVGVVAFDSSPEWAVPLGEQKDKEAVRQQIAAIGVGGGTDIYPPLEEAYKAISEVNAAIKHIVLLSDGNTAGQDPIPLARQIAGSRVTVSTVAVGEDANYPLLSGIASETEGRFYAVRDPSQLPQIFVKEAQVIRRPLILEETFHPNVVFGLSEILKGISTPLPALDGLVLTGPKAGLSQQILVSPKGDPVLAAGQAGLGRCVAFTSSADGRWASQWLAWGGFTRFWEQVARWAGKSAQGRDCEISSDVQGRDVTVSVEAIDEGGNFVQLADIAAQVIAPDMSARDLPLAQVGPGTYRGTFRASSSGSHLLNLRYARTGDAAASMMQSVVTVPHAAEFQDLSDNLPLLSEVARSTGGRIVSSDPAGADLYDRSNVQFPRKITTFTTPLLLVWLGLFLADVAVRRLAPDFKAMARRASASLSRLRRGTAGSATLDALRARQSQLKAAMRRSADRGQAAKRYEARAGAPPVRLHEPPAAPAESGQPAPEKKPAQEKPAAVAEDSHIQRLLKAKRKSAERRDTHDQPGDN